MRKLALMVSALSVSALAASIVPASFLASAQSAGYQVSLSVSRTELDAGDSVVFSGTVSPSAKGSTLKVQYFDVDQGGNRWRTVTTTTVRSGGAYSKTVTPRDGSTYYRVLKPYGSGLNGGPSRSVMLRAYSWYKLANSPDLGLPYGEQYLGQHGPQTVDGVAVTRYWATTDTAAGKTRWSTLHTCKRVRLNLGLDDRSDPGADAQFRIHADEKRIASVRVKKGPLSTVDVAVPRAETGGITFSAETRNGLVPTYVNASKPEAYCALPEDD